MFDNVINEEAILALTNEEVNAIMELLEKAGY
jgi:hypothetical protein